MPLLIWSQHPLSQKHVISDHHWLPLLSILFIVNLERLLLVLYLNFCSSIGNSMIFGHKCPQYPVLQSIPCHLIILLPHLTRVLIFVSGNKSTGDFPVKGNYVSEDSTDEEVFMRLSVCQTMLEALKALVASPELQVSHICVSGLLFSQQ